MIHNDMALAGSVRNHTAKRSPWKNTEILFFFVDFTFRFKTKTVNMGSEFFIAGFEEDYFIHHLDTVNMTLTAS